MIPLVPFFGNPDSTHCFQAVLMMALKYFYPCEDYTWDELDQLTGKKPDKWTWRTRALVELKRRGMDVVNWGNFDHKEFVERGASYLNDFFGVEKARIQIEHCDLEYEIENAREWVKVVQNKFGLPTLEDIRELLDIGYLVICNVNSKILNQQEGYSGHFVVIYDVEDDFVLMHDPGPPHLPERRVSYEVFLKAWEYPNEEARNVIALRL
jgi:hypothetical protein